MRNFVPEKYVDDIQTRDLKSVPDIDLYISGFPCQSFSIGGFQKGFNVTRGKVVCNVMNVIKNKQPKLFLLENVKGLTTIEGGKCVQQIIGFLKQIQDSNGEPAYWVHSKIIDTKDHGVLHARKRWYCVGSLRSASPDGNGFRFPEAIMCSPIFFFLDSSSSAGDAKTESSNVQSNLQRAFAQTRDCGHHPENECILIDVDASPKCMSWTSVVSHCITRSRYRGHWISNL